MQYYFNLDNFQDLTSCAPDVASLIVVELVHYMYKEMCNMLMVAVCAALQARGSGLLCNHG